MRGKDDYITIDSDVSWHGDTNMIYYRKTAVAPFITQQRTAPAPPRCILPTRDQKTVFNNIRECCNFYLLKSIDLANVLCLDYSASATVPLKHKGGDLYYPRSARAVIDILPDYLEALLTKEEMQMATELNSHDHIGASTAYVYNQRLNLSGVYKRLLMPFNPATFLPFCQPQPLVPPQVQYDAGGNPYFLVQYTTSTIVGQTAAPHNTVVYMRFAEDSKQVVCQSPNCLNMLHPDMPVIFFYYPSTYAEEAVFFREQPQILSPYITTTTTRTAFSLPLTKHATLNGAVYFKGWSPTYSQPAYQQGMPPNVPTPSTDNTIPLPNKLYTSEVSNPFLFPYINTIGTGTILGIAAATKALSQGQFGQFPLYAFSTEGVWALEVAAGGTFSARQPITRDVCSNHDGITSLDSAVLFPTTRGLMLLQGSNAVCISDDIASEQPFNALSLPHASQLHNMLGHPSDNCLPTLPFSTFLDGCRLIYDYPHQHIIVYNPLLSYAYVYSLKSKQWGMMHSSLSSTLNSYPDALAMANRNLVSFSTTNQSLCQTLLITRPLKLGSPDSLKAVHTLIVRGCFKKTDCKTVLYASRDLNHWHLVGSSTTSTLRHLRGTAYKYFRIAIVASLSAGNSLASISVEATPRNTPKLI